MFSAKPPRPGGARAGRDRHRSELPIAMQAQQQLEQRGIAVRSCRCRRPRCRPQSEQWKSSVLPEGLPRLAIEAGVTDFWWKYVRSGGAVLGVDRFGESAPAAAV